MADNHEFRLLDLFLTVIEMMTGRLETKRRRYRTQIQLQVSHLVMTGNQINLRGQTDQILQIPNMTVQQFLQYSQSLGVCDNRYNFSTYWAYVNPETGQVEISIVLFMPASEPGKNVLQNQIKQYLYPLIGLQNTNHRHFILFVEQGLTPGVAQNMSSSYPDINFEIYQDHLYAINPMHHVLSPINNYLIPNNQADEWSKNEGKNKERMGQVHQNEAMGAMYGLEVGDVIVAEVIGQIHPKRIKYLSTTEAIKFPNLK